MKKKVIRLMCIGFSLLLLSSCAVAPERPAGSRASTLAAVEATTAAPEPTSPVTTESQGTTARPNPPATTEPTPPVTTEEPSPEHPDPNREKKDILSIPGAMLVENPTFVASGQDPMVQYVTKEEYIQSLRRSFFVALGEIENLTCYLVEEERKVWYIFTFDLKITEGITNIEGTDTIHCITTCHYRGTKSETNECPLMKVTLDIVTNPNGLYVFRAASKAFENEINGIDYNWGDYADYYLEVRYDVSENGFYFVGEKINFEDIWK
ncbi:MAG: hypothetical protein IJX28_08220 [Clostridia bacterium]|nr:hypothetical protein [Clostridia bacterium]